MYFPDLLEQYRELLRSMKSEGMTSGDLYREVKQAIQWMETGYDPAEYRAATRTDAYTMDLHLMQQYCDYVFDSEMMMPEHLQKVRKKLIGLYDEWTDIQTIGPDEFIQRYFSSFEREVNKANGTKQVILGALGGLSDNERAAFIAIEAEKMPYSKVAKIFGVEKATVQSYVRRAKQKIRANLDKGTQESLFDDIA